MLKFSLGFVFGYKNGKILKGNKASFSNQNVTVDENGYFTFGEGRCFDINYSKITSGNPRTFILQTTILENNGAIQLIDGGYDSDGCLFSLGWGYNNVNYLFYHFSYDDNLTWYNLNPGSYIIAFVYENEVLYLYINGELIDTGYHYLWTGGSSYRIGNKGYDPTSYGSQGIWKSKFGIVYDRALTQEEIQFFK